MINFRGGFGSFGYLNLGVRQCRWIRRKGFFGSRILTSASNRLVVFLPLVAG